MTQRPSPGFRLVQASDGNFYGVTLAGGDPSCNTSLPLGPGCGTVFELTESGALSTVHVFDSDYSDVFSEPAAALFQATHGPLYGVTLAGGSYDDGTVFGMAAGLPPFVETVPTTGQVGAAVNILGTKLTGATSVTFNGTAATFEVVSASLITATVPTGATTGRVEVSTTEGTLKSNTAFRVKK